MNIKKRVLVLTSTFPRWQGDKEPPFVFDLCWRLSDQFDILVLAPHADGAKCAEMIDGIEIVRFRYYFSRWERLAYQGGILSNLKRNSWNYLLLPFFFVAQLAALLRILRHQRIDVIHAHWLIPQGLTVAMALLFLKTPPLFICTSHGGDLLGLNSWWQNQAKRWVIHCSTMLTIVSNAMTERAQLLGAKPEKLRIVSMGVDTRNLFTPDASTVRMSNELLFVGRLVEKKGCAFLLDAMPNILARYPDTRLGIVGNGPLEPVLKQQAMHLGISHAVTFHGSLSNSEIPALVRRATIFVTPSIVTTLGDQEGLGLVLVEAQACECPVIASDLPAIRDVISHGDTGWLVTQKNSDDISKAVVKLLSEPELRRQLAINGREHAIRKFDWAAISRRYAALIDEVAQKRT